MRLSDSLYFYEGSGLDNPEYINSNTIIIDGPEKLIIDPGRRSSWPELAGKIEADGLNPADLKMALFTHGHPDHMAAGQFLSRQYGTVLALHRLDAEYARGEGRPYFGDGDFPAPEESFLYLEEGSFEFGGRTFKLILTPGHTPGSLCLHWPERKLLVTGDLYFPGTIGGFHFIGGQAADLFASIAKIQQTTDVDTVICGHCPIIEGKAEVQANYQLLNAEVAGKKSSGRY